MTLLIERMMDAIQCAVVGPQIEIVIDRVVSVIARRRLTIPCLSAKRYVYVWDDICRRLKSKTMALVSTAI